MRFADRRAPRASHGGTPRAAGAAALLAVALTLPACLHLKGGPVAVEPSTGAGADKGPTGTTVYRHPFPAERVVIHPLTRLATDPRSGQQQIELHIEFFDQYAHPVKSLGMLTVELRRRTDAPSAESEQLRRWEVDLSTPEKHERVFDRVTRTDRLLLRDLPPGLRTTDPLDIVVYFTIVDAANSRLLTAERSLGQ